MNTSMSEDNIENNNRVSSATGGMSYSVHKPLVRNGKIPSARGGSSVVYVSL